MRIRLLAILLQDATELRVRVQRLLITLAPAQQFYQGMQDILFYVASPGASKCIFLNLNTSGVLHIRGRRQLSNAQVDPIRVSARPKIPLHRILLTPARLRTRPVIEPEALRTDSVPRAIKVATRGVKPRAVTVSASVPPRAFD